MKDCVFCNIVKGETETKLEKETENLVIFQDINPQAPVHLLIVPRQHLKDIGELDDKVWKEIKDVAVGIARERSMLGFRLVHNAGDSAAVAHMHVHLLGEVPADRAV